MNDKNSSPITDKNTISEHPDNKIDQDYPGFPHAPSNVNLINPTTEEDKKTADLNNKDGEKINKKSKKDEQDSNESNNAFSGTEK
ncbi:MAG: hypothetical protein IPJ81_14480 [Chitinophagaceae bacterium]|nr:hypothetical protein [Chitinophagaceae bacterium]